MISVRLVTLVTCALVMLRSATAVRISAKSQRVGSTEEDCAMQRIQLETAQKWHWHKLFPSKHTEWWTEIPPPVSARADGKPPKIALMLFTKDHVNNVEFWMQWLDHARKEGVPFRLLIHAFGVKTPEQFRDAALRKFVYPRMAPSRWCDISGAEMAMMKEALKDPTVTHLMTLSADSVPVKSLKQINRQLMVEPSTRMCIDDEWLPPRAETWWLMRRSDAELFAQNELQHKRDFVVGACTEEISWYYPLKLRMERWGDVAKVINQCVVFTDWKTGGPGCKKWQDHAALCGNCTSLHREAYDRATGKSPVFFRSMSPESFAELRRSPFWFARKIKDGLVNATS